MATVRWRGDKWHYIIKCAKLLDKPVYFSTPNRAAGDALAAKLEADLARGIIPPEIAELRASRRSMTIAEAIREYIKEAKPKADDVDNLGVILDRIGSTDLTALDFKWARGWVASMKTPELRLKPGTIRHHVGALRRCFEYITNEHPSILPVNVLKLLPTRYATYSAEELGEAGDEELLEDDDGTVEDESRKRRLLPGEEPEIRRILGGGKPVGKQRALQLKHGAALRLLFDMALATAMRLREMYTLRMRQVDLANATIHLGITKTGASRQVPLDPEILERLTAYIEAEGLTGNRRVFPWWDGKRTRESLRRTTSQLSRQFGRIFERAGCVDLHFHDLRHEGISRLFEDFDFTPFEISQITGHKDFRMLDRYTQLRGSELSKRMQDRPRRLSLPGND